MNVPKDVMREIFLRLGPRDLYNLQLVCEYFYKIMNPLFWKKKCEGEKLVQIIRGKTDKWLYATYMNQRLFKIPITNKLWDKKCQFRKVYYGDTTEIGKYNHISDSFNGEGQILYAYDEEPDRLIRGHIAGDFLTLEGWVPEHEGHILTYSRPTGQYTYTKQNNTIYFNRYTPFGAIHFGFYTPIQKTNTTYMHIAYPKLYIGEVVSGFRQGKGVLLFDNHFKMPSSEWNDARVYAINENPGLSTPLIPTKQSQNISNALHDWISYCEDTNFIEKTLKDIHPL